MEPDGWLCPFVTEVSTRYLGEGEEVMTREFPCVEVLRDVSMFGLEEPRGICAEHGVFRWGEVGGWVR